MAKQHTAIAPTLINWMTFAELQKGILGPVLHVVRSLLDAGADRFRYV